MNVDLVPNYKTVFADLKDQPYNTVDGVHYGIPHGRGANLLMWNTRRREAGSDSLGRVLDPSVASKYSGKISVYDDPIYIADAAVYLKAHDRISGSTTRTSSTRTSSTQRSTYSSSRSPLVGEYWSDALKQISAFTNGDDPVGTTWQYQYFALKGDGEPVAASPATEGFLPQEGATGWSDTWMISSRRTSNCMYMWMNPSSSPKVNAEVAEHGWRGAGAEQGVRRHRRPELLRRTTTQKIRRSGSNVYYWITPVADCGRPRRRLHGLQRMGRGVDRNQGVIAA